jgi:hypothetical protein
MYSQKKILRLFWAIIVIISLAIMTMMLESCSEPKKQKEVGVYNVDTLSHINYSIYIIDSCEYIVFYGGSSTWGSHKGNCSNPIHENP